MAKKTREDEWAIRRDVKEMLEQRGWLVEITHGNAFQSGLPDLFCFHRKWGERWIDLKRPKGYSLTRAQRRKWPIWEEAGLGVWILTDATQAAYDLLFAPPNWRCYAGRRKAVPSPDEIDRMLEEMRNQK
jgi:hypothetical protein